MPPAKDLSDGAGEPRSDAVLTSDKWSLNTAARRKKMINIIMTTEEMAESILNSAIASFLANKILLTS